MTESIARIFLPFYRAKIGAQKKAMTVTAKTGQFTSDKTGRASSSKD